MQRRIRSWTRRAIVVCACVVSAALDVRAQDAPPAPVSLSPVAVAPAPPPSLLASPTLLPVTPSSAPVSPAPLQGAGAPALLGAALAPPGEATLLERLPATADQVDLASHQLLIPKADFPPDEGGTLLGSDPRLATLWNERQKQLDKAAQNPGKPAVQIGGQAQADAVYFGQDEVSRESVGDLQDAADFRRARIVLQGNSFDVYRWVFGVDFALAGRPSFLDVYIERFDLPYLQHVRVGHYFEPFSLERVTQNRNNTFMERSLVDTFAPARNLGIMTYGYTENERATWQIGTFRTGSNDYGNDSFDSGQALTMRGTCLPFWDEPSDGRYYMHLGLCYSYRDTYQNQVRFRNSPEIRIQEPDQPSNFGPIFVDTGNIPASSFQLFDAEFAWIHGPFSVQSEYACSPVKQTGGPNLFFDGVMLQLSYFLTGEHRPYDRKLGIHTRMTPFSNFFSVLTPDAGVQRGTGAWEIAGRVSHIKLNDQNIQGNNLTDYTFGLNWYWNAYTRVKFNYIRAYLDDTQFGRSVTNIYGVRMDFEF